MFRSAGSKVHKKIKSHPFLSEVSKIFAIMVGAILVAIGLELFLVPNGFLDGGVVGISIILTEFIKLPLGIFIGVLNIPFLFIAYKHSGWKTTLRTAIGIGTLSVSTVYLHHFGALTDEFTLALGYGGVLLGVGVGLALRYGGALDGTEILSVSLSDKVNLGVDQIILIINFFIFVAAAFIIGAEQALASFLLFYIVVTPMIKKVMERGSEVKIVKIISSMHTEITEAIHEKLNKRVILLDGHRDELDSENTVKVLMTFVSRIEEAAITEIVEDLDPNGIIAVSDVSSISGGRYSKTNHH